LQKLATKTAKQTWSQLPLGMKAARWFETLRLVRLEGSRLDGSMVAALPTEQKTAEPDGDVLRFRQPGK